MGDKFAADLSRALESYGGDITLKDKQRACLEVLHQGKDVVANLPTGYGKSLIFHLLPGLFRNKAGLKDSDPAVVIVVCPLNVIQEDQLKSLASHSVRACRLDFQCNVLDGLEASADLTRVIEGQYDVVFAHPEAFFSNAIGQELLRNRSFQDKVVALVVDECHKAEEWGDKFRTAFSELHTLRAFFQDVPVAALSATLSSQELKALPSILGLVEWQVVSASPDRTNIFLERKKKDTSESAVRTYERVYVPLLKEVRRSPQQFPVTLLYIPLEQAANVAAYCRYLFGRNTKLADSPYAFFFAQQAKSVIDHITTDLQSPSPHLRLIVCTSAIGMGFDAPCIDRVIHAKPPRNLSDYFQQVGRAGRAGQPATATLYFSPSDISQNLAGIKQDIVDYCKTESCLRATILHKYGYEKADDAPTGCKCCSECKSACACVLCEKL